MKAGIGTAQFGMNYGISNKKGQTTINEVRKILQFASENDVVVLDTAYTYGESESVIGNSLPKKQTFRIVSKTPVCENKSVDSNDAENLKKIFFDSLKKLKQVRIEGLLIHNADNLIANGGDLLFNSMSELKTAGFVNKIGVSIYTDKQIDPLLERYNLDIIQVPINVLDRRLVCSGKLKALKKRKVEVHARSIFMQGLLLMNPDTLNPFFDPVKPILNEYHSFLSKQGLTPVEGAFCFIKNVPEIDYVIIGVNNLEQLKVNLNAFKRTYENNLFDALEAFSLNDPMYLNPHLWRLH